MWTLSVCACVCSSFRVVFVFSNKKKKKTFMKCFEGLTALVGKVLPMLRHFYGLGWIGIFLLQGTK
jgi:hypothetical protein